MKSAVSLKSNGFTQVELMISVAIMSIFFLAIISGFGPIAKGVVFNKARSLGTNLAQEQVEKLKALSYYKLLVTASPLTYANPAVQYDNTYYPSENITAGGITFTRLTCVYVAQEVSGNMETLSPTVSDTGMKLVRVVVVWGAGGQTRYLELTNLVYNPNMITTDAIFTGMITDAGTGNPISDARITIAENAGWVFTTGADGTYTLSVHPGDYNINVRAQGYFKGTTAATATSGVTTTKDFSLNVKYTNTLTGSVWLNDHLLISQVVGSSVCAATAFEQEYVELFNPTTNTFTIASGGVGQIDLVYQAENDASSRVLDLDYYTDDIQPYGYYLIANTTTIRVVGSSITADAVFSTSDPEYPDIIKNPDAGGFGIAPAGTTNWYDRFGWDRNNGSKSADIFETEGLDENIGLQVNEQYVRYCSTSGLTGLSSGLGNSYDSGNNDVDFINVLPLAYRPHNSSDIAMVVSGVPIGGAAVTLDDGMSAGTTTYLSGSPPAAIFTLPSVATGTWTAIIAGGGYIYEISTVPVTGNGTTMAIPNASTDPPWLVAGYSSVQLVTAADQGYISGRVTDASNNPINIPNIIVSDGFNEVATDSNGLYLMQTSTGTYTVTANGNLANSEYVSHSQTGVTVNLGQITSGIDFALSQGGSISGFATRDGTNPLPDVVFIAEGSNGAPAGQEISGSDGTFTIINLSTDTYEVYPVLDSGEISNPTSKTNIVLNTPGNTVFSSTFTISGALGTVEGNVTDGSTIIQTGVLIVVTTSTLSGTPPEPPDISSATLTSGALYIGSSTEVGTYSVDVRGSASTLYNVYAFYPQVSGMTVDLKYNVSTNETVTASSSTIVNFSTWLP